MWDNLKMAHVSESKQDVGQPKLRPLMRSSHTFHIPVMGTGFTIDTPIKVAKYGISSVISLVDDLLIEQMRKYYCKKYEKPYHEIGRNEKDGRALRITAYLNLIKELVESELQKLKASAFEPESEITLYFEMLPECALKQKYLNMLSISDLEKKLKIQEELRNLVVPGSIDVNIMTKLDRNTVNEDEPLAQEFSDALSALRGYAKSDLSSAIVFSAGMNQRLYSYTAQFNDFMPQEQELPIKTIILKVSDFRSAEIQGKFLAKRGLWVSEYRIESGVNCGGHAFANKGFLLGPILEEFKRKKNELVKNLYQIYAKVMSLRGLKSFFVPEVIVTVQGGIGTAEEDQILRDYFQVNGTGWGTPFLLVPEVTNVDEEHLKLLSQANEQDVCLSDSSPLNVPFWILNNSKSEKARQQRIQEGKPGSACTKGFLVSNTEFSKNPICHASHAYQKLKLGQLEKANLSPDENAAMNEHVLAKSCICHDLAGGATVKYGIDPEATTTVCCGPNIVNFSKIASLKEMVSHIYGRCSLMNNPHRKNMFIEELRIYKDYFKNEIKRSSFPVFAVNQKVLQEFKKNMMEGIVYYREMAKELAKEKQNQFLQDLEALRAEIEILYPENFNQVPVPAMGTGCL